MLLIQNLSFNNFHQMESAISLRYCPFPYSSKGFLGSGSIRFHLRFNHATPLCAPQFSTTRHPVRRSLGHANCILGRFSQPSQNEGRCSKILRGVTGASLVLACVLGLFNFKMNPKLTTAHASHLPDKFDSPMLDSEVEDHGKMALKSLLKIMNDAEDATHQNEIIPSEFSERGPSGEQVKTLKSIATGQNESAKRGKAALEKLEQQYKKCKNKWPETEQYLGVALVEVYIIQEKLEKAHTVLNEQINQLLDEGNKLSPKQECDEILKLYKSDDNSLNETQWIAKLILYKAIVHTMLEYKDAKKWRKGNKEALEWRKAFIQTL